jgi:hypothetical protein
LAAAAAGGRRAAIVLAVLALVALIAAELLPWATLHGRVGDAGIVSLGTPNGSDSGSGRFNVTVPYSTLPSDPYTVGLGQVSSGSTLVYHLGTLLLFALLGAVLLARPAQRRLASGLGFGVLAGLIVVVVGMVHSFNTLLPDSTSSGGALFGSSLRVLPETVPSTVLAASTTVEAGTFFAAGSLALLLAALLAGVLPDQVRSRLVTGVTEPVDAQFTDEPPDLTVAPVSPVNVTVSAVDPIDESYFGRPDQDPRHSFSRPDGDLPETLRRPDEDPRRTFGPPDRNSR